MPISRTLRKMFNFQVTILKRTSAHTGGSPKPGYQTTSNGKTYQAKLEESEVFVRTDSGHEAVGGWKVFLYSTTAWSASSNYIRVIDRIVMPAGFVPNTPQIISSRPVTDENGIHHWVLKCRR